MVRNSRLLAVVLLILASQAMADIKTARQIIPSAELVGTARLEYLFWDVYDAELYAPAGIWREDRPFALTLRYLLELNGESIAKRSIKEMRNQGFHDETRLASWHEQMQAIFPDVEKNTRLTGVVNQNGRTLFFENGRLIGEISDPLFSDWFFGIWLGESTSRPELRERLLGAKTQ
jgi:hypothetical protein